MASNPTYPLYASDFLTKTSSWDVAEVAIYMRLRASQWVNGGLSSDHERMARICSVDINIFKKAWVIVGLEFALCEDGFYRDMDLEELRLKKEAFLKKQSENGKQGGRPAKTQQNKPNNNPSLFKNESQIINQKKPLEKENEKEIEVVNNEGGAGGNNGPGIRPAAFLIVLEFDRIWKNANPKYPSSSQDDHRPLREIAEFLIDQEKLDHDRCDADYYQTVTDRWVELAQFISKHRFFGTFGLKQVRSNLQTILQDFAAPAAPESQKTSPVKTSALQQTMSATQKAKEYLRQMQNATDEH